eukprot:617458-Prymnesium_polylepis.1
MGTRLPEDRSQSIPAEEAAEMLALVAEEAALEMSWAMAEMSQAAVAAAGEVSTGEVSPGEASTAASEADTLAVAREDAKVSEPSRVLMAVEDMPRPFHRRW